MLQYEGTVIRPPNEADSLIIQATLGCSHGKCTFCPAYVDKKFRKRSLDDVFVDIAAAEPVADVVRRVFLADGDALVLGTEHIVAILDRLQETFPLLNRVGIYANAGNVARKSDDELRSLRARKLGIAYLGLESGDDEVLEQVRKGATAAEMVEAVQRLQGAGIKASVIALLGLGGRERSDSHAKRTAEALNQMAPRFLSFLTVMVVPGTALHDQMERGEFVLPEPPELLLELRKMIAGLDLNGTILRSDHASNYLPLEGRLPRDKERLLSELDAALAGDTRLRSELFRAL